MRRTLTPLYLSAPGALTPLVESATLPCVQATVLVVDDEVIVGEGHRRLLVRSGFNAVVVTRAVDALELIKRGDVFDAIVTDITMPDIDGLALLREVRKHNLDIPVIVLTGNPSLETAVQSIQYGVFRYLTKPASADELGRAVGDAVSLHRLALLKREALTLLASHQKQLGDRAGLEVHFEQALEGLWMAYQPIVDWRNRSIFAYEALVRSAEPTLANPMLLFDAAERLGRVRDVGKRIRALVAQRMNDIPRGTLMFVNLHAQDLGDDGLRDPAAPLSQYAPRVVLEITERNSLEHVDNVSGAIQRLRDLGYRIALDDLGAGYAGLSCFTLLEPDIAKLDMSLIRGIDNSARLQSLVRSILGVCNHDLGIQVVCEGVETTAERDTLESLGGTLLQGYLFGRPERELTSSQLVAHG